FEVVTLFVGELEEDALAFRVFELLAVALEEPVRPAFALDADHQRITIARYPRQLVDARREQAVGRTLEEQERRVALEFGVLLHQLAVAGLEAREVVVLFTRQALEHPARTGVAHHHGRARVELAARPLRGDGDAQRVTREQQFGRDLARRRLAPRAALLAGAVELHDGLAQREVPLLRHVVYELLDVGAQELHRVVARLADEVEVARVPVAVLEAEAPLTEVDLACDAGLFHPGQRAVDSGAA